MREWILLGVVMAASPAVAGEPTQTQRERNQVADVSPTNRVETYRTRGWLIHRTSNFRICTRDLDADYSELAERCEALHTRLQMTWFGGTTKSRWSPRCDIIVHASLYEYQRSLGHGVGRSVGCATLKLDGDRVVSRQIDIRVDADNWLLDALPHELTHVVLADRFAGKRLPRWADEGMGVLAESTAKQSQRFDALKQSMTRGSVYRATDLLHLRTFPHAEYRDAFYGQSAAVVRLLVERESPKQFLDFIEVALESGYDHALQAVYKIGNADRLVWRSPEAIADPAPIWETQPARPTSASPAGRDDRR